MGMLTGIGGGIARDLLTGRVPLVFRGELYATPALLGAVVAVVGHEARAAHHGRRGAGGGGLLHLAGAGDPAGLERAARHLGEHLTRQGYQNIVPGSPLNGPTTREVTQPP